MPVVPHGSENYPPVPDPPAEDQPIWRFMSLSKFLSMLTTRKLYFPQIFTLKKRDPFEGSYPRGNFEFAKKISTDDDFVKSAFDVDDERHIAALRQAYGQEHRRNTIQNISKIVYVSCWHISDHENAGLWSQYASEDEGIAIRSTVGNLRSSLKTTSESIYLGSVQYSDYQSAAVTISEGNILLPMFSKSLSFSHEKELRACLFGEPNFVVNAGQTKIDGPPGKLVDCDLDALVSEIYVAPFSPSWLFDTVQATVRQFACKFDVKSSSIVNVAFE